MNQILTLPTESDFQKSMHVFLKNGETQWILSSETTDKVKYWVEKVIHLDKKSFVYHNSENQILLEISEVQQKIWILQKQAKKIWQSNGIQRQWLLRKWQNKEITLEDFQSKSWEMERLLQGDIEQIWVLESKERLLYIDFLNSRMVPDEKISHIESLDLPITLDSYLWKNIQNGGSNARWVFELIGTNLLAIEKSEKAYEFIGNLTYLTSLLDDNPRIPRTLKVFVKDGKTYQIVERARGVQLDLLSLEIIESIPQAHFDQFVRDIQSMGEIWIIIDPSKSSNFFYDTEIGFVFVDLSWWKFLHEHLETNLLSVVLAWRVSPTVSEKIKNSIRNV